MTSWTPQSQKWPGKRAVLFVHGIGNSKPGDYDPLIANFKNVIGEDIAKDLAIYFLYYDQLNDWAQAKVNFAGLLSKILKWLKDKYVQSIDVNAAEGIADFAGDVIMPVLDKAARAMIRTRYLAQLLQINMDAINSGVALEDREISIIAHSMGCFHTYETLWEAAVNPDQHLAPFRDGMQFKNVILMAPPVQLIRSVAKDLGGIVPKDNLATVQGNELTIPSQENNIGKPVYCTPNWVSITGNCDPVGGYLLKHRLDWAYMNLSGQKSYIDDQSLLNIPDADALAKRLLNDQVSANAPKISLNNPHSWDAYIDNHKEGLQQWLS